MLMRILEGSVIYRWLTAVAAWLDRQWEKSFVSLIFVGGGRPRRAAGVISRAAERLHALLFKIFGALGLTKALDGSIFRRTFFWCTVAAFMAPFAPTIVAAALVVLAVGSLILDFCCDRERHLVRSNVTKWVLLLAAVYLICTFTAVNFRASAKTGLLMTAFILFAIVVLNSVKTKRQEDIFVNLLVAAGLIVVLYGFAQVLMGVESDSAWLDEETFSDISLRVYSTFGNPNVLSEYLLLIIPLAVSCVFTAKTAIGRICGAAVSGAMILCMVLTYSRAGWLGLALSAAVFLVLLDRRFIVIGAVGVAALPFLLPQSMTARIASIGNMSDKSNYYRYSIWMGTLNMLKDYWFCGVGPGSFNEVYPLYSYNAAVTEHAHNLYLQIVSETGVAGIGLFLAMVMSLVRAAALRIHRGTDRTRKIRLIAVISGLAGFFVQGMAEYTFYNYHVMLAFWALIGLGAALASNGQEDAS